MGRYKTDVYNCVYRYVLNKTGEIIYIGKAKSLRQRINDHAKEPRFQIYNGKYHIEF